MFVWSRGTSIEHLKHKDTKSQRSVLKVLALCLCAFVFVLLY